MPACKVGCCPDNICNCATDCECLLPSDKDFHGQLGVDDLSLLANDDLEKSREESPRKICPCKSKLSSDLPQLPETSCCNKDVKSSCCGDEKDECCSGNSQPESDTPLLSSSAETPETSCCNKDVKSSCCGDKKDECCSGNSQPESDTPLLSSSAKMPNEEACCKDDVGSSVDKQGVPDPASETSSCCKEKKCGKKAVCDEEGVKPSDDNYAVPDPASETSSCCKEKKCGKKAVCEEDGVKPSDDNQGVPDSSSETSSCCKTKKCGSEEAHHEDGVRPSDNLQDVPVCVSATSSCCEKKKADGSEEVCHKVDVKALDDHHEPNLNHGHDHHEDTKGHPHDSKHRHGDNSSDKQSKHSDHELQPLMEAQPDTIVDIGEERIQTTKLRVQNICCPKEGQIVDEELQKLDGIKTVRVNVIGRVAYVSHNPDKVSPTDLITALNQRHLGASIVDTGDQETGDDGLPPSLKILLLNVVVQTVLFGIALGAKFSGNSWYMWVAIVQIVLGVIPLVKKVIHATRHLEIDLNILITVTVIGTLAISEWIEAAAVVFVFTLATFLQQYCYYRVQKTIASLMLSKPSKAIMASTGECLPIEKVAIGSVIAVRQGELIPLDGTVVKGNASVDESSISGESVPVEKTKGSQTYSGTVIQHGYLEIETTSTSKSSTISKISEMVEDAQMNVSPTELLVNKFAKYYTPLVVLIAGLVFLIPLFLGLGGVDRYKGQIKEWGEKALIVLVTACPCSLLMATPIVVICGISGAARLGALIKGGTFLEGLAQLTFLAFDKTGTLTEGKFQVVDLVPVEKEKEKEVLRLTAALESKSSHPLAAAVVTEYTGGCIADFVSDMEEEQLPEVSSFHTMEGQGIRGDVEGHHVEIGNKALLERLGISLPQTFETAFIEFCEESKTVVFVCIDGELALMISLADIIRSEARGALTWLQELGVHLAMLTGDSKRTATAVQKKLNIDSCVSEMKPDDKLQWISEVKEEEIVTRLSFIRGKRTHVVGMVGDGVNDGPALASANVGIAMAAGGSALAVEAAGVALMTNSVLKVPEMISLSRFCRRVIVQNIVLAIGLKLVFVIVAFTVFARVWMAVLADLVGLLVVIFNGLRPLKWQAPKAKRSESAMPMESWTK